MALNLPKAAHLLRSTSLEYSEPVHGTRNIVLALDTTEQGQHVIEWACSLYKPGDVFHICHIAKILSPQEEVFHGVVGTSLKFHESSIADAKEAIQRVKQWWKRSVNTQLEARNIPFVPHFFVDTTNAPSDVVAATVAKVAEETDAALIIAAKSNKTSMEKFFMGSVAEAVAKHTNRSLFLVV